MQRLGVALFLGLLITGAPLQAAEDRDRLQGVWRFQREVNTKLDGSPVALAEPSVVGLLVYTADGFVPVILMPKGRKWSSESATAEELRATVAEGTGYAGRYEVDPARHTVTHIPSVSLEPGDEGRRLVRNYAFESDALLLSGDWTYNGETLRFTVTWVRAQ